MTSHHRRFRVSATVLACLVALGASGCSSSDDGSGDAAPTGAADVDLREVTFDVRRDPG